VFEVNTCHLLEKTFTETELDWACDGIYYEWIEYPSVSVKDKLLRHNNKLHFVISQLWYDYDFDCAWFSWLAAYVHRLL